MLGQKTSRFLQESNKSSRDGNTDPGKTGGWPKKMRKLLLHVGLRSQGLSCTTMRKIDVVYSWSDTVRSLEYTNQVQPGDQGVRLQGGRHLSRVSAYNKKIVSNVTLRLKQRICQLDLILSVKGELFTAESQ